MASSPLHQCTYLISVKPRRQCLPTEVRQRGAPLRRDGAQAALPGEGDQEGWHPDVGYRGEPGGPAAPGDDRLGSYLREAGERATGSESERRGAQAQLPGAHRAQAHLAKDSSLLR